MSSILAGTALLTAISLFSQIVGFLYRVILSRLIGAETMGLYQLVMPVYSLLMSVTAVGLTVAVSTLSARYHALGDRGAIKDTLRRALGCFLLIALPLGLAVAAASDPISVYLIGDARTRLGIVLLVPCVLLTGVENLHKHCFYGIGRIGPPAATETIEQLIRSAAVIALLLILRPATGEGKVGVIVTGMVLCEVFSAVTLTLLFRRHWRQDAPKKAVHTTDRRQIMGIAIPVSLTSLLGTILGSANSVLIPARLVAGGMENSAAMSSFGILCGMTLPLLAMPTGFVGALCLTMVPDLARRTANGDRHAAGAFLDRVLSATSILMSPAMALMAVIGPAIGQAVYRQAAVGDYMGWLAIGMLLSCWQSVLGGALNGLALQKAGARNAIISDIVQLAFTFFTVSRWGLPGFVAGFVLSSLVGMAMNLTTVLRAASLRPKLYRWFCRPLLASALLWGWCKLFFGILLNSGCSPLWSCILCAALGLVLYTAALQVQGVSLYGKLPKFAKAIRRTGA